MTKVGIMGGTFNPVHISHLLIAARAYDYLNLDKVLFMPSKMPPHKPQSELVSEKDRCAMLEEAIKDYPFFELSDFELLRDGVTYTADTLTLLKEKNPDTKYYFIIGGDSLDYFDSWHNPDIILKNSVLVCAPRASESRLTRNVKKDTLGTVTEKKEYIEYDYESIVRNLCENFKEQNDDGTWFIPEIVLLPSLLVSVSSSQIREYVRCGQNISCMVPKGVEEYILSKQLYCDPEFERMKTIQKEYLKPKRYRHILDVAATAYKLAVCHGVDPVKAYTAGLLHDCAKHLDDEEIIKVAEKSGIEIDEVERRNASNLLHSKVGSVWACEKFGIKDKEILSSIYYHTTGKPDMSKLELIIYLSDMLEPGREIELKPSLDVIRTIATYDLELAIFHILDNVVPYILKNYRENVCMMTVDTYDYYNELIASRNKIL